MAWGNSCRAEVETLRGRVDALRKAIKLTPATTIFGVGVRMVAGTMCEEDHRETFFCTLETVGKLSGTDFRLPPLRI
jgi:hypothetical protein